MSHRMAGRHGAVWEVCVEWVVRLPGEVVQLGVDSWSTNASLMDSRERLGKPNGRYSCRYDDLLHGRCENVDPRRLEVLQMYLISYIPVEVFASG